MKIGERRETLRWIRELKAQMRRDELLRRRVIRRLLKRRVA